MATQQPSNFGKTYRPLYSESEVFMVEIPQWDRLQRRVTSLESAPSTSWLLTTASALGSLAASTVIAIIALPAPSQTSGIGDSVKPILWVIAAFAAILAVICFCTHRVVRGSRTREAADIGDEMKTIRDAWQRRDHPASERDQLSAGGPA